MNGGDKSFEVCILDACGFLEFRDCLEVGRVGGNQRAALRGVLEGNIARNRPRFVQDESVVVLCECMSGLNPTSGQTQTYDEWDLPERLIRYVLGGFLFMLGEPDRIELVGFFFPRRPPRHAWY